MDLSNPLWWRHLIKNGNQSGDVCSMCMMHPKYGFATPYLLWDSCASIRRRTIARWREQVVHAYFVQEGEDMHVTIKFLEDYFYANEDVERIFVVVPSPICELIAQVENHHKADIIQIKGLDNITSSVDPKETCEGQTRIEGEFQARALFDKENCSSTSNCRHGIANKDGEGVEVTNFYVGEKEDPNIHCDICETRWSANGIEDKPKRLKIFPDTLHIKTNDRSKGRFYVNRQRGEISRSRMTAIEPNRREEPIQCRIKELRSGNRNFGQTCSNSGKHFSVGWIARSEEFFVFLLVQWLTCLVCGASSKVEGVGETIADKEMVIATIIILPREGPTKLGPFITNLCTQGRLKSIPFNDLKACFFKKKVCGTREPRPCPRLTSSKRHSVTAQSLTNYSPTEFNAIEGRREVHIENQVLEIRNINVAPTRTLKEMVKAWLKELWPYRTDRFSASAFNSTPTDHLEEGKLHREDFWSVTSKKGPRREERGIIIIHNCWRQRGRVLFMTVGRSSPSRLLLRKRYWRKELSVGKIRAWLEYWCGELHLQSLIKAVGSGVEHPTKCLGVWNTCRLREAPTEAVGKGVEVPLVSSGEEDTQDGTQSGQNPHSGNGVFSAKGRQPWKRVEKAKDCTK
eukprot:Gb_41321 [translate_table: standard]